MQEFTEGESHKTKSKTSKSNDDRIQDLLYASPDIAADQLQRLNGEVARNAQRAQGLLRRGIIGALISLLRRIESKNVTKLSGQLLDRVSAEISPIWAKSNQHVKTETAYTVLQAIKSLVSHEDSRIEYLLSHNSIIIIGLGSEVETDNENENKKKSKQVLSDKSIIEQEIITILYQKGTDQQKLSMKNKINWLRDKDKDNSTQKQTEKTNENLKKEIKRKRGRSLGDKDIRDRSPVPEDGHDHKHKKDDKKQKKDKYSDDKRNKKIKRPKTANAAFPRNHNKDKEKDPKDKKQGRRGSHPTEDTDDSDNEDKKDQKQKEKDKEKKKIKMNQRKEERKSQERAKSADKHKSRERKEDKEGLKGRAKSEGRKNRGKSSDKQSSKEKSDIKHKNKEQSRARIKDKSKGRRKKNKEDIDRYQEEEDNDTDHEEKKHKHNKKNKSKERKHNKSDKDEDDDEDNNNNKRHKHHKRDTDNKDHKSNKEGKEKKHEEKERLRNQRREDKEKRRNARKELKLARRKEKELHKEKQKEKDVKQEKHHRRHHKSKNREDNQRDQSGEGQQSANETQQETQPIPSVIIDTADIPLIDKQEDEAAKIRQQQIQAAQQAMSQLTEEERLIKRLERDRYRRRREREKKKMDENNKIGRLNMMVGLTEGFMFHNEQLAVDHFKAMIEYLTLESDIVIVRAVEILLSSKEYAVDRFLLPDSGLVEAVTRRLPYLFPGQYSMRAEDIVVMGRLLDVVKQIMRDVRYPPEYLTDNLIWYRKLNQYGEIMKVPLDIWEKVMWLKMMMFAHAPVRSKIQVLARCGGVRRVMEQLFGGAEGEGMEAVDEGEEAEAEE
ncbi:MAG: hypothetical protein EZS28_031798, partial [Streblomastix strix]